MANVLTASRLLLIPVVIRLILAGSGWAFAVFAAAAVTDLLDGAVARRTNRETEFGRLLDPLTDRLFISGVAIALYLRDFAPPFWALGLLVGRDLVIMAGSAWMTWRRRKFQVTFMGKAATALLLLAILLLVARISAGLWLFYAGLALYLGSGFNYLTRGKELWESGEKAT